MVLPTRFLVFRTGQAIRGFCISRWTFGSFMASSVKNVLDSLTHQVLVESLFGPGCIHLRQLRLQVAIVRVVGFFFFSDYFLACVSCFVSAYSGELWTRLAMILYFLLSPLLNSFPLSFHIQLYQPSAVDHLLCQPFFSPKKKKKKQT